MPNLLFVYFHFISAPWTLSNIIATSFFLINRCLHEILCLYFSFFRPICHSEILCLHIDRHIQTTIKLTGSVNKNLTLFCMNDRPLISNLEKSTQNDNLRGAVHKCMEYVTNTPSHKLNVIWTFAATQFKVYFYERSV